jgi:hypothetical protein
MSLLTPWGYELSTLSTLDSILSVADFNTMTANKYSGDTRIAGALSAASQNIRDYCGWHLYPSTGCKFSTTFYDCRVSTVHNDILIQLPARFVSAVTSVKIADEAYTTFVLETNGILRVYDASVRGLRLHSKIEVEYTAGIPDTLANAIKDVTVNKVVKELVKSNGVQSETAGGVSISYNAAWMADASASTMSSVEKATLSPYQLKGVF